MADFIDSCSVLYYPIIDVIYDTNLRGCFGYESFEDHIIISLGVPEEFREPFEARLFPGYRFRIVNRSWVHIQFSPTHYGIEARFDGGNRLYVSCGFPSQTHVQNNVILNKMVTGTVAGGKVKDNKPRGRMTAYAFFVQTCREEHKKKHPEEQVIFAEFSRKCAERWKTMLDKEKQRFHEMAEKDKARYELEMQSYVPPKGAVVGRGKKRKQFKDPNAPKRSLSAFFWFCHDERNKVKALNPEYGVGDIAKELGRKWSDMDAEIKQKYEQMAEKDKQRYEQEMTEYKLKCKNEQGGGTPGLNLPQQLQQAGLQHLPQHVQQAAAAQLQAQVVQAQQAAAVAAAAAAAVQQQHDDDDDEEDGDEDDNE